ncbi:MAG: NAD(P)-dependent oxidoreductase [Chloroflexi bacterium]|nr:NAD(P)-dependent oxidoreductase [Chloroflexota bacterium]
MNATLRTVGLFSPGEMGSNVARVLRKQGLEVVTCLHGRSPRTRRLAAQAGLRELSSVAEVARQADLVLSIVVPAAARSVAAEVARGMTEAKRLGLLFADCNSIAPSTALAIEKTIAGAGGRFVDASIIGSAQHVEGRATFYASGPDAPEFARLAGHGLRVEVIGPKVGQASGLKMLYAGMTKGLAALSVELFVPAQALGLLDQLLDRVHATSPEIAEFMQHRLLDLPMHAARRSDEMDELAQACQELGLPSHMAVGARDSLKAIGDLNLRSRYSEDELEGWDLRRVVRELGEGLRRQQA